MMLDLYIDRCSDNRRHRPAIPYCWGYIRHASGVRVQLDSTAASQTSFQRIAFPFALLPDKMPNITTLILSKGAQCILPHLMVILSMTSDNKMVPALPRLRWVVLEGVTGFVDDIEEVKRFVDWREETGFPLDGVEASCVSD
ncbi:hypothetical protein NMY22_g19605 [Coprinellus aureogranulatus]|nr:hypothetical protein NMY22_g19605 [Coprinellus aureogranulatus]